MGIIIHLSPYNKLVIPAKAGIQKTIAKTMDTSFRWYDNEILETTNYVVKGYVWIIITWLLLVEYFLSCSVA